MAHPLISYHGGHSSEFCDHAEPGSTTAEIVEAYLTAGFTHVGITEHRPPHTDAFLYPDERSKGHDAAFLMRRFDRYFTSVREQAVRSAAGKLQLLFGFETEYYGDDPLEQNRKIIEAYQPDLVVASVHHVNSFPIDFDQEGYRRAAEELGGLDALYGTYYDHQLGADRGAATING